MSRTIGNLTVTGTTTVAGMTTSDNIIFDEITNDLTLAVLNQSVGPATATIPNFASVSDTFVFDTFAATLANKTLSSPVISGDIIFDEATFDLTLEVDDQGTGVATVTIPDMGGVSDTFVFLALAQTLTNKTLTGPIIDQIEDANGNESIIIATTASAINEITVTNAATLGSPTISATGGDTNIALTLTPKGTGAVVIAGDLDVQGTTTTIDSVNVSIADRYLFEGAGNTTNTAVSAGLVVDYLPTLNTTTITSFTSGAPTQTIVVASSASFTVNDIVEVVGANTLDNNGIYVIETIPDGTSVTIKVSGTEDFASTSVTTDAAPAGTAGTLTQITVSVMRSDTSGDWEVGKGAVDPISYTILATATGVDLQTAYDNSTGGATAEIVVDATRGAVTIRDSVGAIGADLFAVQNNSSVNVFGIVIAGTTTTGTAGITSTLTLGANIVFDKTNDLTMAVTDQTTGTATATIPDLDGVSQDFIFTVEAATMTNKTLDSSTNTVRASSLATTGAPVVVVGAAPPTTGQHLVATSATTAAWSASVGGWTEITANTTLATALTIVSVPTGGPDTINYLECRLTAIDDNTTPLLANVLVQRFNASFIDDSTAVSQIGVVDELEFGTTAWPGLTFTTAAASTITVLVTSGSVINVRWKLQYRLQTEVFS